MNRVGRAAARFSERELEALNARVLHGLDWSRVADRLKAIDPRIDMSRWEAVRGNINQLADMLTWTNAVHGPLSPTINAADRELLDQASQSQPPEPWAGDTWNTRTRQLTTISGRKGRALFQPLRRALTARDHGPELARLLPLMGRDRVLSRLQGQAA